MLRSPHVRVQVSLFLQEGIQTRDGCLYLPRPTAAPGSPAVGTVRFLAPDGAVVAQAVARLAAADIDPNEFYAHPLPLGDNLYDKVCCQAGRNTQTCALP